MDNTQYYLFDFDADPEEGQVFVFDTLEDVQAIALVAAYSENGFVLIATALRFAIQIGLPLAVDQLIAKSHARPRVITTDEQNLYRLSRVWHGICNLELL